MKTTEPNQSLEPMTPSVTTRAFARVAPAKTTASQLRCYSYLYLLAASGLFYRSGERLLSPPDTETEFSITILGIQLLISVFAGIKFWSIHKALRAYEAKADIALGNTQEQQAIEKEFKNA